MWKEFKEFAVKGNAVDLAVGVIIGAAFGKIVSSIVEDLLMPPVGRVVGNLDFSNLYVPLSERVMPGLSLAEAKKLGPVFAYGNFITITINFVIVAFSVFLFIRQVNRFVRAPIVPSERPPAARECPYCLSMIPARATRCAHCTSNLPAAA